ncbi:HEAT repeat domain-containing protein [Chitinivorax sp. B]|uniref:HEAT repeat domain-containing protein n=1 Tax=Chitinivorax sp. B TaxID=2502235 RepID=UPI0010F876E6|nr:HEAT repeat domain-containing protein [Chitinivorax sp. B]
MNPTVEPSLALYRPGPDGGMLQLSTIAEADGRYGVRLTHRQPGGDWQLVNHLGGLADQAAAQATALRILAAKQADGYLADGQPVPAVTHPSFLLPDQTVNRLLRQISPDGWRLLKPRKQSRLIWQLGELRITAAVPRMVALLGTGDVMLDYCLAWAIGRCGDVGARPAMQQLMQMGRTDTVRRVATLASMALADIGARADWAQQLIADWSAILRDAWVTQDPAYMLKAVHELVTWQRFPVANWLESLDLVAQSQPAARQVLITLLTDLPLTAGNFRVVRHLYKAAEFRGDGEVWALLQRRFESVKANFRRSYPEQRYWLDGKWVNASDELARDDSRLAYSQRTREYLLRRGWRGLRRLGAIGSPEFAPLAFAALRQFDDAQAPATHHDTYFWEERRWQTRREYRHAHAASTLFNRLLFRPDGPVIMRAPGHWSYTKAEQPAKRNKRYEPFAHLWNNRPDLLLQLALSSRAEWVQAFAVRALADCTDYCAQLDDALWQSLINSPFEVTADFAYTQVAGRIAAETDLLRREQWLVLLLGSRHPRVVQAGLAMLEQDPAAHATSPALVVGVLTARSAEVRRHGRLLCQIAATHIGVAEQIVSLVLDWLALADQTTEALDNILDNLAWVIANPLRQHAAQADYSRLLALTCHIAVAVRCVAIDWLIGHQQPLQDLPPVLFKELLDSDDARLLSAGLRLLGALPAHLLAEQSELVGLFCVSEHATVRDEAFRIVDKLLAHDMAFADALVPKLLAALYRAETATGLHADLHRVLTTTLAQASQALPHETVLRLLLARTAAAQGFGAWLLAMRADAELSAEDWVKLARCDTQTVRQRALTILDAQFANLSPAMLLPILDGRWDDSRTEVLAWLRQRVKNDHWQVKELIALADHAMPVVQALGCELLSLRLAEGRDTDCLLALAEHPSLAVQGFVARWLQQTVGDDPAQLVRFRDYFRTVLSQVNKGRQVKKTIHALLRQQALQSEALAREVAELFEWLAVTVAIGDKAQYVAGLFEIQRRFPAITSRLTIAAPAVRGGV